MTARSPEPSLDLPMQIGPVRIDAFVGRLLIVVCPAEFAPLLRRSGGMWDQGTKRWMLLRERAPALIEALRDTTDPLFRQAGMNSDRVA